MDEVNILVRTIKKELLKSSESFVVWKRRIKGELVWCLIKRLNQPCGTDYQFIEKITEDQAVFLVKEGLARDLFKGLENVSSLD